MPVILELISDPEPDDLSDLVKLYQDYPQHPTASSTNGLTQWVTDKLNNGQQLFAGRFNGRLLCAVWGISSPDGWQLEHLCVRAVTRRRGVALQLLTLLAQHAIKERQNLTVNDLSLPTEVRALLPQAGFHYSTPDKLWIFDSVDI